MKILGIEEITGADTIRKHVEAGGTVNADGTLEQPATESQVAAVGEALARPAVVNAAASRGLAARTQLEAQELDYQISEAEHVIEQMNAKLVDLMKARSMAAALLREYHQGK